MSWHPVPGSWLCSRFLSALLEKPLRVCIPSILCNRKGTFQSKEGPVSFSYHNIRMANSAMVRSITRNVGQHPIILPNLTILLQGSQG